MDGGRRLSLVLWVVALHSLAAGLGLILTGPAGLQRFGYALAGEPFFAVQGGVFHLVLVLAYVVAALNPAAHRDLVLLAIAAKAIALLFLVSYYLFVSAIVVVLVSGLVDGAFGLAILLAFRDLPDDRRSGR
jgi:hypothetical protein